MWSDKSQNVESFNYFPWIGVTAIFSNIVSFYYFAAVFAVYIDELSLWQSLLLLRTRNDVIEYHVGYLVRVEYPPLPFITARTIFLHQSQWTFFFARVILIALSWPWPWRKANFVI